MVVLIGRSALAGLKLERWLEQRHALVRSARPAAVGPRQVSPLATGIAQTRPLRFLRPVRLAAQQPAAAPQQPARTPGLVPPPPSRPQPVLQTLPTPPAPSEAGYALEAADFPTYNSPATTLAHAEATEIVEPAEPWAADEIVEPAEPWAAAEEFVEPAEPWAETQAAEQTSSVQSATAPVVMEQAPPPPASVAEHASMPPLDLPDIAQGRPFEVRTARRLPIVRPPQQAAAPSDLGPAENLPAWLAHRATPPAEPVVPAAAVPDAPAVADDDRLQGLAAALGLRREVPPPAAQPVAAPPPPRAPAAAQQTSAGAPIPAA